MSIEDFYEAAGPVPTRYINEWTKDKKSIGFFCSYVPEELIHAAGILPIRMNARGHPETDMGDGLLSRINCTYCRSTLDKALKGDYDFLEGLVALNSCDHARRTFDNWAHEKPMKFTHFLSVPHHATEEALEWYEQEIIRLKASLQDHFKVDITPDKLKNSIKVFNESRKLLKDLYEKRKEEQLKITGTEAFAITIASTALPREQFNQMLSKFLETYETRPVLPNKTRLMVIGSIIDDVEYIKLIESMGAHVVTDAQCYGSKYFWNLTDESKDPIKALSERYLNKPACPRMLGDEVGHETRLAYVKDMIKNYYVDGVVLESLKFCDLHSGENYMLMDEFKKLGVPFLVLDREYALTGAGQMKTRVQPFLEVLA